MFVTSILVALEQVSRLQRGQKTVPFERLRRFFAEADSNSFSLIYGDDRSLDLCAPTPDIFNLWYCGLSACLKNIQNERQHMDVDYRFLKVKWDEADTDKSGMLTRKEVLALVASMNVDRPTKVINRIFKEVDRDQSGTLNFEEFIQFIELLRNRFVYILFFNFF